MSSHKTTSIVLVVAGFAYLVSVSQRSTLGAAAIVATQRFQISGEQLALLAVAQLGVYALMQIPVGILLDRFGSRKLLVFGGFFMALGQLLVAYSLSFPIAAVGRLSVGFGDAFTFISIIRLINGWFEGKSASRLQQWVGNFGQLGQVLSSFGFLGLLHLSNWTGAFLTWSSLSLISCALVWLLVSDDRKGTRETGHRLSLHQSAQQLLTNLREPTVRMSFWIHFLIQSPGTVMVLLWGMPFLVAAEGLLRVQASSLMSLFVFVGIGFGFIYGQISAHRPAWRKHLVIVLVSMTASVWLFVLSFNGKAPYWVLFLLFVILGISGPGSMLAFDFTKSHIPIQRLGSANGFVNIGGFLASFTTMFLIGVLLDVHHALQPNQHVYSVSGFRFALPVQFLVLCIGTIFFLREYRKLKSSVLKKSE